MSRYNSYNTHQDDDRLEFQPNVEEETDKPRPRLNLNNRLFLTALSGATRKRAIDKKIELKSHSSGTEVSDPSSQQEEPVRERHSEQNKIEARSTPHELSKFHNQCCISKPPSQPPSSSRYNTQVENGNNYIPKRSPVTSELRDEVGNNNILGHQRTVHSYCDWDPIDPKKVHSDDGWGPVDPKSAPSDDGWGDCNVENRVVNNVPCERSKDKFQRSFSSPSNHLASVKHNSNIENVNYDYPKRNNAGKSRYERGNANNWNNSETAYEANGFGESRKPKMVQSADDGWGPVETKAVQSADDGWGPVETKVVQSADDGWGPVEPKIVLPKNGWETNHITKSKTDSREHRFQRSISSPSNQSPSVRYASQVGNGNHNNTKRNLLRDERNKINWGNIGSKTTNGVDNWCDSNYKTLHSEGPIKPKTVPSDDNWEECNVENGTLKNVPHGQPKDRFQHSVSSSSNQSSSMRYSSQDERDGHHISKRNLSKYTSDEADNNNSWNNVGSKNTNVTNNWCDSNSKTAISDGWGPIEPKTAVHVDDGWGPIDPKAVHSDDAWEDCNVQSRKQNNVRCDQSKDRFQHNISSPANQPTQRRNFGDRKWSGANCRDV